MHASEVLKALGTVHPPSGADGANWPSEEALLAAIEAKLRTLPIKFVRRPITRSRSRPELLVDSEPDVLLAICMSGDWRAAVAATQLSAGLTGLPLARPVVVPGAPADNMALKEALVGLGITIVECSRATS